MDSGERLNATIQHAVELLTKFVVPLYVVRDNEPSLLGSGFFVRSKAAYFLVSAAHVLEVAGVERVFFYQSPTVIRALTGKLFLNSFSGDRRHDPIDVGVLRLGAESQPPYLEVDKFAMDESYLAPVQLPRTGKQYACIGFPASRSRINPLDGSVKVEPHAFLGRSIAEQDYTSAGKAVDDHIVLQFDPKRSFDLRGQHRVFPKPHGISGAPLIALFDEIGPSDERVFPVVGVVTEFAPRDHLLFATDVERILQIVRDVG